jgi:hypothetical protein
MWRGPCRKKAASWDEAAFLVSEVELLMFFANEARADRSAERESGRG